MLKETLFAIVNGIKRAVKFVIDVLLFIPRIIVGAIKCNIEAWLDDNKSNEHCFYVPIPSLRKPVQKAAAVGVVAATTKAVTTSVPAKKETTATTSKPKLPSMKEISKIPEVKVISTDPVVVTPVDTDLPKGFAEKTSPKKESSSSKKSSTEESPAVAADKVDDIKVAVVPAVTVSEKVVEEKATVDSDNTKVEKVEGVVVDTTPETVKEPASSGNADNKCDDATHINLLRHDDIGWMELQALDHMQLALEPNAYDKSRNFVNNDLWGRNTTIAMRMMVDAMTQRLGITTPVDPKNDNAYYESLVDRLVATNNVPYEWATSVKSRVCRYCCMLFQEAERVTKDIYCVMSNYFSRFYGILELDSEELSEKWTESRIWFANHNQKPEDRYTPEVAAKYLPETKKPETCECGHTHSEQCNHQHHNVEAA